MTILLCKFLRWRRDGRSLDWGHEHVWHFPFAGYPLFFCEGHAYEPRFEIEHVQFGFFVPESFVAHGLHAVALTVLLYHA